MCDRKNKLMRMLTIVVAIAMVLGMPAAMGYITGISPSSATAYAADDIEITSEGDASATVGNTADMSFTIKNKSSASVTFTKAVLTFNPSEDIDVSLNNATIILAPSGSDGSETVVSFSAKVKKAADTGSRSYSVQLFNDSTSIAISRSFSFSVYESLAMPGSSGGNYVGAADITQTISPAEGFTVGDGNTISFAIFNNGNTVIKNAKATLTLPDGLSFYNSSNSEDLGYISVGSKRNTSFSISVDDTAEAKNYAVTLAITGLSNNNTDIKIEKTFYVPVLGGTSTFSSKNINIQGISIPSTITSGKDFTMSFNVANVGTSQVKNMKVYVELPEGLMNKTTTTFVENAMAAGSVKSYSVKLFSNTGGTTYPVKIGVAPLSGTDKGDVIQYVSCYVEGDSANAKTPQLMIDSYSYGGSSVQAGSTCVLHLDLFNTSGKELTNVKVSLKSEDGVFVPLGGSSSFFVESIPAKGHYAKSVMLSVKAAAEQGTSTLGVAMNYEDGNGNSFTPEDVIAIPVTQATRLVVDDIVAPMETYVGEMGSAEIEFYNMGKSVLNNVRINATGNFDTYESNSYYAGNMASGSSDSYTFTFVPREIGSMEGTVVFTYENAGGEEETYEVPFAFEVMDAPIYDDEEMYPEDEGAGVPWKAIIAGIVVVVLVAGFVIWRKLRKRKLNKELELADSAFMDSMDIKDDADGDNNLGKGDGTSVATNSGATRDAATTVDSGAKIKAKANFGARIKAKSKSGTDGVQNGDKK